MTGEGYRGGIHAIAGGLSAAMALYNLMRFAETRTGRHGFNAALYLSLWVFEQRQVKHHWSHD